MASNKHMTTLKFLFCSQYLALEGDVERLSPTTVQIFTYTVPPPDTERGFNLANLNVVGPQASNPMMQLLTVLGTACDALMANATLLAQVEVCPFPRRLLLCIQSSILISD